MLTEVFASKFVPDTVMLVMPGAPRLGVMMMLSGGSGVLWAHTEEVGNTAIISRKITSIRNICWTRRYPNIPQAGCEGLKAAMANRPAAKTGRDSVILRDLLVRGFNWRAGTPFARAPFDRRHTAVGRICIRASNDPGALHNGPSQSLAEDLGGTPV